MEETIKIYENDIKFIKNLIDLDANVLKCQKYMKENFNIDSEFDKETVSIKLKCNNVNESLNLLAAKEYIKDAISEHFVNITFG